MKEIKLTQGLFAQVDDEDFEYLNQWKWYVVKSKNKCYAVRHPTAKSNLIFMHRIIMNTPLDKEVDHEDHNGLNCQKYNMRNCTHQQNCCNALPRGKSKYLGVSYNQNKYIMAHIRVNKKTIYLGVFKTEEEAALAYNEAANHYFGEFANLNFKK